MMSMQFKVTFRKEEPVGMSSLYGWGTINRLKYYSTSGRSIPVGDGFTMQTMNEGLLRERGLLDNGVLHLANGLADLEAQKDSLPEEEWVVFERSLASLTVGYDTGELYYYLLHGHGPAAINYNLWVRFSLDSSWGICIRTFKDMPTDVLEEYGRKVWHQVRRGSCGWDGRQKIYAAIGERKDIYGAHSMPTNLAVGILFDEDSDSKN